MEKYELFIKLLNEEKIYMYKRVDFKLICAWLSISPKLMNFILKKELGFSGEALLSYLREKERLFFLKKYKIRL